MIEKVEPSMRIVVVGASAAGLRAAARAKRLIPDAQVTVIDQEKIISFGACGLPYYISGDIETPRPLRETLWGTIRDPEFFKSVKAIDVRNQTLVESVDSESKSLQIVNLESGDADTLSYDKFVLATGASPLMLPGIPPDHPRIFSLKTIEDAIRWRKKLETGQLDKIAIIGSGFIGLELAEAFLAMWGATVDLIEAQDHVLPQVLDEEMSYLVQAHLEEQGVMVHTGCPVSEIRDVEEGLEVIGKGKIIQTQFAVCCLGVKPRVELAEQLGLEIGSSGGIVVDDFGRTSLQDVYAAGDCVEVELVSGRKAVIPLGSLANKQGRAVGDNIAGRATPFGNVAGSACVKVFDTNVAVTGVSEKNAQKSKIAAKAVWGSFSSIAHYYPGDKIISLKLIYEPETQRLLGLQAVGPGDVVKRVDVFGNLLKAGGRLEDLLGLEFAYSPPFSPAIDPLFTIGAAALNQEDGIVSISPSSEIDDATYIDLRSPGEAENAPIEGTVNIPLEEFRNRLGEIPKDKPVRLVCARGARSAEGTRILMHAGFCEVVYVAGGYKMLKKIILRREA